MYPQRFNPDSNTRQYLESLSNESHSLIREQTEQRIKNNPTPTDEEIIIGAYWEMIEPQVRSAVKAFNEKGYTTTSSGFYSDNSIQGIDGNFEIDEATSAELVKMGVRVRNVGNPYTIVEFDIDPSYNLATIAIKWGKVAEILPKKNKPGFSREAVAADIFRKDHAEPARVERILLERRLEAGQFYPAEEQTLRKKLENLKAGGKTFGKKRL